MAELHKNQVAWAAPEPVHVQIAKKQDYVASALNQVADAADKTADFVARVEDVKIESEMKAAQEQALNELNNSKRLRPEDYVKDKAAAIDKVSEKLSTYSPSIRKRFMRENPQYMQMFELAAEKVALDKRVNQTYSELKQSLPLIASEAIRDGTFDKKLNELREAGVILPAEKADELEFDFRQLYGEGMIENARLNNEWFKAEEIIDDIEKTPGYSPYQRAYLKGRLQDDMNKFYKDQTESYNKAKGAVEKNAEEYVSNYLYQLQKHNPSLYAEAMTMFYNESSVPFYVENDSGEKERMVVSFVDSLSQDAIKRIYSSVKGGEQYSLAAANESIKVNSVLDQMIVNYRGMKEKKMDGSAAQLVKIRQAIDSPEVAQYVDNKTRTQIKEELFGKDLALREAFTAQETIVRNRANALDVTEAWSHPTLNPLLSYQLSLTRSAPAGPMVEGVPYSKVQDLRRSGVRINATEAYDSDMATMPYPNSKLARTATQGIVSWIKDTYGLDVKPGTNGEVLVHMMPAFTSSKEYSELLGINNYDKSAISEAFQMTLANLIVDNDFYSMRSEETAKKIFDSMYYYLNGVENKRENGQGGAVQDSLVTNVLSTSTGVGGYGVVDYLFEPSADKVSGQYRFWGEFIQEREENKKEAKGQVNGI